LALSSPLSAAEVWLDLPQTSTHSQSSYWDKYGVKHKFNAENEGLGVTYKEGPWSYKAGYYDNSYYDTTAYLGAERDLFTSRYASIGLAAGIFTGYEDKAPHADKPLLLGAGPVFSIFNKDIKASMVYLPGRLIDSKHGVDVLTFTLSTKFK